MANEEGGEHRSLSRRDLLRAGVAAATADLAAFGGFFTDDVVVHIPGKSSLAGDYRGKGQFLEVFGRFTQAVPGYSFEPHAYLADDEHGVSLQKSEYKGGGDTIDSNDVFVCHFRDGKISEFWLLSEKSDEVDALIG